MGTNFNIQTVITSVAVIIALIAVIISYKNNKKQILTNKLEEIFSLVQFLTQNYGRFIDLKFSVDKLRDSLDTNVPGLEQYYNIRDSKIPEYERFQILDKFNRLDVLTECYTKNKLNKKLSEFHKMIYSLADLVFNGGSVYQEIMWNKKFPDYKTCYSMVEKIKKEIVKNIKT